jgi:hypothetical protein
VTFPVRGAADATEEQLWVLRQRKPVAVSAVIGLDDESFVEIVASDVQPGHRR